MKKYFTLFVLTFIALSINAQNIIHYWHFNNLNDSVGSVPADYTVLSQAPEITYPGSGAGYMDDVNDGDDLNLRQGQVPGNGLRVRNPSDLRELIIPLPTNDHEDIVFSYAVKRTNNGAQTQLLSFSIDGGNNWSNAAPFLDSITVGTDYAVESFDFSSNTDVNDNPDFVVRIQFFNGASNTSGNNRFDNIVLEGQSTTAPPPSDALIHYWHFNTLSGREDNPIPADYTLVPNVTPEITYVGVGDGYVDDYSPGSSLNLQLNEPPGAALRVRNPSFNRALIIDLPSNDCEDIYLMYDVHRSGSGMLFNNIAYTVDGVNYDTTGLAVRQVSISENYQTFTFDFRGISTVNDNPNFKVRITWDGNTNQTNGNNRYDNVAMFAEQTTLSNRSFSQQESFSPNVYPNPASSEVFIEWNGQQTNVTYRVVDMQGRTVLIDNINGNHKTAIDVSQLSRGLYTIVFNDGNHQSHKKILLR
ncbi:MAG: T9SS type A sorting domain-containing protein [Cryomorphaceae bacterium]|nr:T9SS type A sorting domain-containing protein [Cryomorphaceae bacterium]